MNFLVVLVVLLAAEGLTIPLKSSANSIEFVRRKYLPSPEERLFPASPFIALQREDILLDYLRLQWEITFFKSYISTFHSDMLMILADAYAAGSDLTADLPEIELTILRTARVPQVNITDEPERSESVNCENISSEISINDEIEQQVLNTLRDLQDYREKLSIDASFYDEKRAAWSESEADKLDRFVQCLNNLLIAADNYEDSLEDFFATVHQVNLNLRIFEAQCRSKVDEKCQSVDEFTKPMISKVQESFYFDVEVQFAAVGGISLDVKSFMKGFIKSVVRHQDIEIKNIATALNLDYWSLLDFKNLADDLNYCAKVLIQRDDAIFDLVKEEMKRMLEYLYMGLIQPGFISLN